MSQINIPSDKRRPGSFVTFDFESGPVGLVSIDRAIALVGAMAAGGSATVGEPTQVFDGGECDSAVGQGTPLALMGRKVFEVFRMLGSGAEVYLVPIADPAGTAATRTFTMAGTATEAGEVVVKIAGRTLRVPVANGDAAATVAVALETQIDSNLANLPGTAGVAGAVCTFTFAVTGVNGNSLNAETVSVPAGITCTVAVGTPGAGTIDITAALDALASKNYQAIAISNKLAADVTDAASHLDEMWAATAKRFRWLFMGENGTLGTATTVASGGDRKDLLVGTYEGSGSLPGEIAAALAALAIATPKPSYNFDGQELPLFPPSDSDAYSDAEVETALAGGTIPLTPGKAGRAKVERFVTTQTTDSAGNPFENLRDYANSRTLAYYAEQIDIAVARAIQGQNLDAALLRTCKGIAYSILLIGQSNGDLHNVEEHKDEIQAAAHPDIPTRILLDVPEAVVPNAHQVDGTYRLIVEGAQI